MKVLSGSAISQLSSRLLSPLQQVCLIFDLYRKQFDSHFLLIYQARPISSSAVRMDQTYRIEADTFGELKVKKIMNKNLKKIMSFLHTTYVFLHILIAHER